MRLLKLSANRASFRTVEFKREGLSLVVADQKSTSRARTSTYNGVGKSLLLEIIHYCLGSNKKPAFERHLKGWVFYLVVDIDGTNYTISRSAEKHNDVSIDGEEISPTKLKEFLHSASFDIPSTTKYLTFRSLISRFVRAGRAAYVDFTYAADGDNRQPYGAMLRMAYLLGLDVNLAQRKYALRSRERQLQETMEQLQKDPLFAALLAEDTVDIELTSLREDEAKLAADLQEFRVAEDYHDIQRDADLVKRRLGMERRELAKLMEALAQIERSLKTRADIPSQQVYDLYAEAQAAMPELVRRRIDEVVAFQAELQRKRALRLAEERQRLQERRRVSEAEIRSTSSELDAKLRYLGEHRALDEYTAVVNALSEVRQRVARLEESRALRTTVDRELKTIDRDLADENIRTEEYLDSAQSVIASATRMFRQFATELYGTRKSGLAIRNEDGDNQQRYRIEAHIAADAAEGINEAKLFCFDMTLLALQRRHRVQFLVHDSTLFGPIDPRQRLGMFRIADRICREKNLQYIATLNLHDITSIQQQVPADEGELESLFGDANVVLRLTDESARTKLLGIEVDMDYTK